MGRGHPAVGKQRAATPTGHKARQLITFAISVRETMDVTGFFRWTVSPIVDFSIGI